MGYEMTRRRWLRTAAAAAEAWARVSVADNGEGIPDKDINKMFSVFESRKGNRGTGLGLPVSKKILREHGGDIRVASQVGEGSCFILELPAIVPELGSHGDTLTDFVIPDAV